MTNERMKLEGYAELADIHKAELALVGGFDLELVSEALGLGQTLRQRSTDRLTGKVPQEQKDTLSTIYPSDTARLTTPCPTTNNSRAPRSRNELGGIRDRNIALGLRAMAQHLEAQ